MRKIKYILQFATILILTSASLTARTRLTTIPVRENIRLDLKNNQFTLSEEERVINLQKGRNHVEFSWANTDIDMTSIQIRPVKTPGQVNILNVNYPPGENALFWELSSEKAGPSVFRISYLIGNIDKTVSYEAQTDKAEKTLSLKGFFTLANNSGEKFENALLQTGYGPDFRKSFEIGEAKKMLAMKFEDIPVIKVYHFDSSRTGEFVRMFYELLNTPANGMGKVSLPYGKARIFQEDSGGSEAFLGEDWGNYTPRGKKMELFLGEAKEVKIKRVLFLNKEEKLAEPLKNYRQVIRFQIENFKDQTVPLVLHEHPGGEWVLGDVTLKEETGERDKRIEKEIPKGSMIKVDKKDVDNLEIEFKVPHTKKKKLNLYVEIVLKNRW